MTDDTTDLTRRLAEWLDPKQKTGLWCWPWLGKDADPAPRDWNFAGAVIDALRARTVKPLAAPGPDRWTIRHITDRGQDWWVVFENNGGCISHGEIDPNPVLAVLKTADSVREAEDEH